MFYANLNQKGEGCDYTIGCGYLLIKLRGNTYEEAFSDLKKRIRKCYTGDRELEAVTILEVNKVTEIPDTYGIYTEIEQEKAGQRQAELNHKEKVEYERLKAKFGAR
jgi:hypothetical protein